MASNPMQRKINNAILITVIITILIMGAIFGLFAYQMIKKQQKEAEAVKSVYVLAKDVKAGESLIQEKTTITKKVSVNINTVPTTAITEENYSKKINKNSVAKINLKSGTVLSEEMIIEAEDITKNDIREQEYNMIVLPSKLEKNDYIDIRLSLPSGEDFIVAAKKKVLNANELTVWINVSESEILTISNAIVEAYQISGSKLYATTYTEPGIQEFASLTYIPSDSVSRLISRDPNVVDEAKAALANKISSDLYKERSDVLKPALDSKEAEQAIKEIDEGVENSIKTQTETREKYLKELKSASTSTTTNKNTTTNTNTTK